MSIIIFYVKRRKVFVFGVRNKLVWIKHTIIYGLYGLVRNQNNHLTCTNTNTSRIRLSLRSISLLTTVTCDYVTRLLQFRFSKVNLIETINMHL